MRAVALGLLVLGFAVPTTAGSELERETLSGLRGVDVLVERLDTDSIERTGLSPADLNTAIELRLRKNGITVFDEPKDANAIPLSLSGGYLHAICNITKSRPIDCRSLAN